MLLCRYGMLRRAGARLRVATELTVMAVAATKRGTILRVYRGYGASGALRRFERVS